MTLQPPTHSELSSPVTAVGKTGGTPARQITEPMREMCALALLAGNAVFLFLGFSHLFFVLDGWVETFGQRCTDVFSTFVGPLALGMPLVALLLATHVRPMVGRARMIVLAVLISYGVSALFGAVTFLGAFAHGLVSVRATLEGTLERAVWLGFLVLVCVLAVRVQLGLFPRPKPRPYAAGYLPTTYGQPYPGQPMYPQTYPPQQRGNGVPGAGSPAATSPGMVPASPGGAPTAGSPSAATSGSGWPAVPPPPMPAPLVVTPGLTAPGPSGPSGPYRVDPALVDAGLVDPDPTTRIALPVPVTADLGGEATQIVRAPGEDPTSGGGH